MLSDLARPDDAQSESMKPDVKLSLNLVHSPEKGNCCSEYFLTFSEYVVLCPLDSRSVNWPPNKRIKIGF